MVGRTSTWVNYPWVATPGVCYSYTRCRHSQKICVAHCAPDGGTYFRASDFPFQKKQFSVSKKAIFRFKKREILFRFRFIIAKIEFDEITIYQKKYSIKSKLSLD